VLTTEQMTKRDHIVFAAARQFVRRHVLSLGYRDGGLTLQSRAEVLPLKLGLGK
jgi:hypothetical protein